MQCMLKCRREGAPCPHESVPARCGYTSGGGSNACSGVGERTRLHLRILSGEMWLCGREGQCATTLQHKLSATCGGVQTGLRNGWRDAGAKRQPHWCSWCSSQALHSPMCGSAACLPFIETERRIKKGPAHLRPVQRMTGPMEGALMSSDSSTKAEAHSTTSKLASSAWWREGGM